MHAGAYADGWNLNALRNHPRDFARHQLQHYRKDTGIFERERIVEQPARGVGGFSLYSISAELIDRLRRQTDVAHHRDFFVHQPFDQLHTLLTAFELHRFGLALFYQTQRRAHGVIWARVKRSIRHVGYQQSAFYAATHGFDVDQNLFKRNRHGVAVTEHDVAETVADQDDIDTRFIDYARGRIIVSSQTNQALATRFTGD